MGTFKLNTLFLPLESRQGEKLMQSQEKSKQRAEISEM
jgi:hypothetical protein